MDDLSGLDWLAQTPSKPTVQPTGRSAFDYLSTARAHTPVSQPMSNSGSIGSTPKPSASTSSSGTGDAFSSLFDGPLTVNKAPLSMAARLAATGRSQPIILPAKGQNIAQDTTSMPVKSGRQRSVNAESLQTSDPWDFELLAASSAPSSRPRSPLDVLTTSNLTSAPVTSVPLSTKSERTRNLSSSPFDNLRDDSFGFQGQIHLPDDDEVPLNHAQHSQADEVDDFLIFNQPAKPPPPAEPPLTRSPALPPRHSAVKSPSRPSSPPPHILGQLVEMGFGIQQARIALIATRNSSESGWDIQAAAEALMGAQDHEHRQEREQAPSPRLRPTQADRGRADSDHEDFKARASTPLQEQGADLLAQASELGFSVLKSANSYWKSGRKAVQKAVEERIGSTTSNHNDSTPSRPRWMTEALEAEADISPARSQDPVVPFWDGSKSTLNRPSTSVLPPRQSNGQSSTDLRPPQPQESVALVRNELSTAGEPRAYKSPHWHKVTSRSGPSSDPPPSSQCNPPQPAKPLRPEVKATPAQLSSSDAHRSKGNELFKLGRFSEAETSYSHAIAALPEGHLQQIVLLNNRATTRLRTGNDSGAIEDCTRVVTLGANGEALGKALSRRAKALEVGEKWSNALDDWIMIQRGGDSLVKGAGGTKIVGDSVQRCRQVVAPTPKEATNPRPVVGPKPVTKKPELNVANSSAVLALRSVNAIAESEDVQRLSLKDDVDSRLLNWRSGKEANLRALIASLDAVLWPELGWKRVGMHELVTESQLKVRYVKAIAKVHPDKLNAQTTVEHRMIANGVFAALSEAWRNHRPT